MATPPVTHPSADALRAFALGKLNENSAAALMSHLDGCADCCKQLAALAGNDFLNRLRQERSHSYTASPAKALSETAGGAKPVPGSPAIANLPPELANNPQYQIVRELGRGGMGVVYLAKNKLMDRLEVLKVVNKALLDHPGAVERFLREIRSAAKLNHANVVAAYSVVQHGELLAFAMEYVEGQDLASLVKSQGPLSIPHACFYVQQAAHGLQHAFEKGMVHRDIKPQNLILAREGKKHIVKVLDFGLAKATREKKDNTGLTGEGKMLGTPDYIAPEQTLDAAKADIRADIYSLGCTLYYLLSGHPPFSAASLGAILLAHQMQEAKPLNLVRPEVPEELAAVVRRMMAKSPAKRYQTPLEVVQALSPFVKQGTTAKPSSELSTGSSQAKPAVKVAAPVAPIPAPAPEPPKPQPASADVWGSLTDSRAASVVPKKSGSHSLRAATVRERSSQMRWLIGGGIGAGVLMLVLMGMWVGGVFEVKTKYGTLVVEVNEPNPHVYVDDEKVTVTWQNGGKKAEIAVKPGTHKIEVKKDGFSMVGKELTFKDGNREVFTVRLLPNKADKPEPKGDGPPPVPAPRPTDSGKLEDGFTSLSGGKDWEKWYIQRRIGPGATWDFGPVELHGSYRRNLAADDPILATKRDDWREFQLRFEVKLDASEVIFCCRDQPPWLNPRPNPAYPVWKNKGYGVLLADNQRRIGELGPHASGSLFVFCQDAPIEMLAAASEDKWKKGEWNQVEVSARAESITVAINGTTVVQYVDEEARFRRGYFSLNPAPGCELYVRNVRIRELPAADFKPIARPSLLAADTAFVPLFSGKDLTGWKVFPQGTGGWKVEAGLLTGRGPQSHLFSERGDYENFHLRIEARINHRADSGVFFRSVFDSGFPAGCEAQINTGTPDKHQGTGILFAFDKGFKETLRVDPKELHLMEPDRWFTMEVIAEGNHIVILVNGKKAVDHKLAAGYRTTGHLALQQFGPGTVVEFRKIEIKVLPGTKAADQGFVPLFNGRDLTGWKTHPKQPGNWKVEDGILVGSGPMSHLYSERGDYENFHYRVEAMISDGGNSGQYFRAQLGPRFPTGYEAQINSSHPDPKKTGSLYGIADVTEQLHKPNEWFRQEVIAEGDHIVIKVNDKTVVDKHDSRYKKGHFALQQHDSATVVKFRKIEVKELPGGTSSGQAAKGPPPEAKEAAKAYEKACSEARAKLLADFDTAIERLAKMKGPAEQRLKLIEAVKAEKKRFDDKNLIPWSEPMRPFLDKYRILNAAAEQKLRRAYSSIIIAQQKAKNESVVSELQADLANVTAGKLIAKWRVITNGRQPGWIAALYSNGRIYNGNGQVTDGTWIFSNGVLTLRWPNPKAPGGAWLDSSSVSPDGTTYTGANNAPAGMKAKFSGTYLND